MSTLGFQLEKLLDSSLEYPTLGTRYPETQPGIHHLVIFPNLYAQRLPDGMYLILHIRHSASGLNEILDG